MLVRLAALATLGYAAYRYWQSTDRSEPRIAAPADIRLAGGPLSSAARLQHSSDEPPSELDPAEASNPT